jgi:hypothetical protein
MKKPTGIRCVQELVPVSVMTDHQVALDIRRCPFEAGRRGRASWADVLILLPFCVDNSGGTVRFLPL